MKSKAARKDPEAESVRYRIREAWRRTWKRLNAKGVKDIVCVEPKKENKS